MTTLDPDDATTPVREGLALDLDRLDAWLAAHVPDYRGPLSVRQFKGGQSNPTYLLATPARRYVLRRKPPGALLPSAHAVDREFRVIDALRRHTDVPVARAHALCTDDAVIGTWFYVMEHVVGRIFWNPAFPEVETARRRDYFDAMNAAIASLHSVDWAGIGLADFGKPQAYVARQVARWSKLYRGDEGAGRVPAIERLSEWLAANAPTDDAAALVHGDFRCDNMVFHPTEPRVLAILDWELATIGHPLADFAYHAMMYRMPTLAISGLAGLDLPALGIPSEEEYVAAYGRRTGRASIPDLDYYYAFCLFRLACILHGIRGRLVRGTAVSARAREYASHVEGVADLGWAQAERAMRGG